MKQKSQEFKKVGECLYRNGNKIYSALLKVGGKQIKRSLKTNDLALAKRRLAELREKANRQTDKGNRNIRFEELAEMWLASIKPDLKKASHDRRVVAIAGLKSQLAGKNARSIGYSEIDEWKRKRGALLSPRSHSRVTVREPVKVNRAQRGQAKRVSLVNRGGETMQDCRD